MSKLVSGEQVRIRTRAHPSALVAPAVWLVLIGLVFGFWRGFLDAPGVPWAFTTYRTMWIWVGYLVAGVALFVLTVRPVLSWLSQVYEVTTHRVAQRYGVIKVRRRWLALSSVVHMTIRQSRRQRKRGSGNLQLHTAHGKSWTLKNIPHVEKFAHFVEAERYNYAAMFGPSAPYAGPPPQNSAAGYPQW